MANVFHQKQQVADLSPEINIFNKFGLRLPTMTFPKPHISGSFVHWIQPPHPPPPNTPPSKLKEQF